MAASSASPEVSVVMGIHNGAATAARTIGSILGQAGVDLEFIVVDDGSTDEVPAVLAELALADARLRVLRQERAGLTRALIAGCALARGTFIARQDCGDISLPGRLQAQVAALRGTDHVALLSCGTRFTGPGDEWMYDITPPPGQATERLRSLDLQGIRGPSHHGSTMFRRDLYEKAGGYRREFYFAQDLDLWTRLVEHGEHLVLPSILYQATFALGSISGVHRERQFECAKVILECARLRRGGESEAPALARAVGIRPGTRGSSASERAAALYFVGMCLRANRDRRARYYFRQALRTYPLHLKAAMRLALG